MSDNVLPSPGYIFSCSVCAGNVTRRGRLLQCCTCFKWVHSRCSLLSSKFKTLDCSHSWSYPLCCIPVSSGGLTPTNNVCFSSGSPASVPPLCYLAPCTPASSSPSNLLSPFHPLCPFFLCILLLHPLHSSIFLVFFYTSCFFFLPWLSQGSSMEYWRSSSKQRCNTTLYLISSFGSYCIQETNLNSSSSFRIPGFSALWLDYTPFQAGILFSNDLHDSSGVVIFLRQRLSFSELF